MSVLPGTIVSVPPFRYQINPTSQQIFSLTPPLPTKLDIEPTVLCNFRCTMCQLSYWDRTAPNLTLDQFKHILAQFPTIKNVKIQGIGEPLLNRDLFAMAAHARTRANHVATYINGSLLDRDDNARRMLDSGFTQIRFSLDGGTPETFERIRRRSDFNQVVRNITEFTRLRGTSTSPVVEAWCTVSRDNLHELERIVEIAHGAGCDALTFQTTMNTFDYKPDEIGGAVRELLVSPEQIEAHIQPAVDRASVLGLKLVVDRAKLFSPDRRCPWPFDRIYISAEGEVVPCCQIADPRVMSMGNILKEPLEHIWWGERYMAFRRHLLADQLPATCESCYQKGSCGSAEVAQRA